MRLPSALEPWLRLVGLLLAALPLCCGGLKGPLVSNCIVSAERPLASALAAVSTAAVSSTSRCKRLSPAFAAAAAKQQQRRPRWFLLPQQQQRPQRVASHHPLTGVLQQHRQQQQQRASSRLGLHMQRQRGVEETRRTHRGAACWQQGLGCWSLKMNAIPAGSALERHMQELMEDPIKNMPVSINPMP